MMFVPSEIFKAYDIRGIVGQSLTEEIVHAIGKALGTMALRQNHHTIAVGRDGRLSGESLLNALIDGIVSTGANAIDLGLAATPMTYFAAYALETHCCVAVTGSHNPSNYNGLKMVIAGNTLSGEAILSLKHMIETDDLISAPRGRVTQKDIASMYFDRIADDVKPVRPMKIIVDAGNGVAGAFAPELYRRLGASVTPLFCEVNGHFPNHHPDPSKPENLSALIDALKSGDAELGFAFDGDGDRLGVVTPDGEIIYPDRQLMLFAQDVLSRVPHATIIYDIKSTRLLSPWISKHGGTPLMWKTGHSLVKAKMKETGAALAGEMSGHVFFAERWYGFDDALYSGARLLEILSKVKNPAQVLRNLPNAVSTPELTLPCRQEGDQHAISARLKETASFPDAEKLITIDGLRVEFADGFGLARPSNTTPSIVLRFEADNKEALDRIQSSMMTALNAVMGDANLDGKK
ncbi:MAG: phosphomannomutase/phosphoglucomutase [Burkholderiales bacterium]|jgi:phosphomannomutase/phosphoglucomutase|nr:phosphomannomutase/phosphoglucomutase [Burkholderiales bacterium]